MPGISQCSTFAINSKANSANDKIVCHSAREMAVKKRNELAKGTTIG